MTSQKKTERPRRALLVIEGRELPLRTELVATGYETAVSPIDEAHDSISRFSPDVVLIELPERADGTDAPAVVLARRLRNDPSTYALPVVFMWSSDERSVRNALSSVGADDYFSKAAPVREVLARLDSLFWRIEAGRRTAPGTGDHRLEIDNFMVLLDRVRDDIKQGGSGTVGLLYAVARDGAGPWDKSARDRTLAAAYGYLKLNLRRSDSVTFYGPTTLLIYMPRMDGSRAVRCIENLRFEFLNELSDSDFAVGLASFQNNGTDLETVIEHAESTVSAFRRGESVRQIAAFGLEPAHDTPVIAAPPPSREPEPVPETKVESCEPGMKPPAVAEVDLAPQPVSETDSEPLLQSSAVVELPNPSAEVEITIDPVELHQAGPSLPPEQDNPDEAEIRRTLHTVEPQTVIDAPSTGTGVIETDQNQPEPPAVPIFAERHETAQPRKTFVSEGIDARAVGDLSMADIVQKVTAARTRKASPGNGAGADQAQLAVSREKELRDSGATVHRRLLLVVSDTRLMATLNSLVRDAGYQVRSAFNGRQALDLMRVEKPDVVLLDYNLRGFDGMETVKRMATVGGGRVGLPMVMLMDPDNKAVREDAKALGVWAILAAPYEPAAILTNIREARVVS